MATLPPHFVNGRSMVPPFPEGMETLVVGMGCFWGAEQRFWETPGVWTTAVGYAGGQTPDPGYREVCSGATGHAEAVLVVFDPEVLRLEAALGVFWNNHDPTQGMRQGNDVGSQYRSCVFVADAAQRVAAEMTRDALSPLLADAGFGPITTQISERGPFHYAEEYHQQYLAKNPAGYCGLGDTGVTCPTGVLG
ncbi:MAG: peptide-methionine (S)-S-oxide reductase MsrA [Acidimicrobiia bacterium]|nr:peptide-methionine (S)-S-oxide reductase MsrA [Actinomycetota bacterium]MBL6924226.1 peptide-methionine (S)-S-oxide reductase MsrA [Acidimicrobiia bacterium]MBL6926854.1 peptide-methionine (S)-S-oxide reductase MsrA [Acidimicrobiia bacterium]